MGKYMRKGRGGGGVAVMEVSQGSMGVRTRARTLALQRDLKGTSASMPALAKSSKVCIEPLQTTTSYLELRSRRLQKVSRCFTAADGAHQQQPKSLRKSPLNSSDLQAKILREDEQKQQSKFMVSEEPNRSSKQSMSEVGMSDRSSRKARRGPSAVGNNSASFSQGCSKVKSARKEVKRLLRSSHLIETQDSVPQNSSSTRHQVAQAQGFEEEEPPLEASFGENVIDHDSRERHMRETTPSSLIGDGETLEAPGSTTRPSNAISGRRRMQNEGRRNVPTSHEMEEFFAGAEQQQQRLFTERYNYDPVNDLPLPGRYEWVRLRP